MNDKNTELCIALAALFQTADLVRTLAYEGTSEEEATRPLIESLFNNEASNAIDVYGSPQSLTPGLELIIGVLGNSSSGGSRSMDITRYAINLIHLEKKLGKSQNMGKQIIDEIETVDRQRVYFGDIMNGSIIARLAQIYQDTVSTLEPKIIVKGEENQLKNSDVAAKIRALLLAGIRAAVLWRQVGGGRFTLMMKRGALTTCAREMLQN